MAQQAHNFDAYRNVTMGIYKSLNATIEEVQRQATQLKTLFSDLPEYIFGANNIMNFIRDNDPVDGAVNDDSDAYDE